MTEEDEAFEELSRRQGDWGLQGSRKHQIMRYLENDAMREVQRLGQKIEQEPYSVQQAYAMAQVCLDLHEAIGCKWGDNVYFAIDQLKSAAHPPQRTEQNFCPRCGKRTKDIHTCTPPQEGA